MRVRVVDSGTYSEPVQQAIERVLVDRVAAGEVEPTLRFWYRETPAVPLGRFQAYDDEVEADYADERGIDVVRRITGGGAMYVEPGSVITYSLYLPRSAVSDDVEASYAELDQFAIDALRDLGLDASHEPLNDIAHPDGKIGGAAQLRTDDAVLHHTTMSYRLDTAEMLRVLRIGEEKVSDKAIQSAEKRVARISDHVDASRREVVDAMIEAVGDRYDTFEGELSAAVLADARELAAERFATDEWNRKL
ncbi:lipoate--protein ligase family protein [Halapricum salinum]|uniref:Lipoate--protein ligase family protein n=1 Tax=Halapricum salinum TaxID=1457250 RepID=A0A4D6HBI0_9EURY|nr:biotin/lipoate A/B protein ligase family protein [Halapricum salinum]QCC51289.1 lipoate--protein ligase family protein [Halapricum salinum]